MSFFDDIKAKLANFTGVAELDAKVTALDAENDAFDAEQSTQIAELQATVSFIADKLAGLTPPTDTVPGADA